MFLPAGVSGRRAGMSQCLVTLSVGQGVLARHDLPTVAGCTVTFEGCLFQSKEETSFPTFYTFFYV